MIQLNGDKIMDTTAETKECMNGFLIKIKKEKNTMNDTQTLISNNQRSLEKSYLVPFGKISLFK